MLHHVSEHHLLLKWNEFTAEDLIRWRLVGAEDSSARRSRAGARLGIGFANGKTFLKRLNSYGVTREEFESAMAESESAIEETEREAD